MVPPENVSRVGWVTHLESNKPNTLHEIADEDQVLEDLDAGNIEHHVKESKTHQALVEIKTFDENLWPVGVDQIPVDVGDRADWVSAVIPSPKLQFKPATRIRRIGNSLDNLKDVNLASATARVADLHHPVKHGLHRS